MAKDRELYSILGLNDSCSDQEIRDAYSRLSELHAEGTPERENVERAYRILGDMDRRAVYDITGKTTQKTARRRTHSDSGKIEKARYALNTLFLACAAVTTVLFILQWCGAGTAPFYWACGISIVIKLTEYILRLF